MLKVIIFTIVSACIVFISWDSFRNPQSHGFWRFFAFESLLILILLNVDYWFSDPFSINQIISWLLLCFSLILAVHGFYLLHAVGKPGGELDNTTVLIRQGAYKYIRHPLYASLLLLGGGVFFKNLSLLAGTFFLSTIIFLIVTAKMEESENIKKFGSDYAVYMKITKMFIPFLL